MSAAGRLVTLGDVMQIAYVPSDFDAALKFWLETMGVGPFYVLEHSRAEWGRHRGQESNPDITIALGHWGEIQIEIIKQHDDAPSPYRDWRLAGHEGVHHVCILTDDIAAAKAACREAGTEPVFNGGGQGAEWIYVDTGGGPGTMLEVLQHSPASRALMDMIRDAAQGWDGKDPVRRIKVS